VHGEKFAQLVERGLPGLADRGTGPLEQLPDIGVL
jgi:hypothetical protein